MGPLSSAQLPEEEGSVSAPTCCDSVPSSRGGGSLFSSTGQTVESLLASAEPPDVASWFYSTSGDFSRGVCWEEAVVEKMPRNGVKNKQIVQ